MATAKKKVSAYLNETLKEEAEALARSKKRSLSNLIELLLEEAVKGSNKNI